MTRLGSLDFSCIFIAVLCYLGFLSTVPYCLTNSNISNVSGLLVQEMHMNVFPSFPELWLMSPSTGQTFTCSHIKVHIFQGDLLIFLK